MKGKMTEIWRLSCNKVVPLSFMGLKSAKDYQCLTKSDSKKKCGCIFALFLYKIGGICCDDDFQKTKR